MLETVLISLPNCVSRSQTGLLDSQTEERQEEERYEVGNNLEAREVREDVVSNEYTST